MTPRPPNLFTVTTTSNATAYMVVWMMPAPRQLRWWELILSYLQVLYRRG